MPSFPHDRFNGQSDRDILIATAVTVHDLNEKVDERDRRQAQITLDIERRVRALEKLRWVIWGAMAAVLGSAGELVRGLFVRGKL